MARKVQSIREVDRLTPLDYQIFEMGRTNANAITDYYFRTPTSGTRWMAEPKTPDPDKEAAWMAMFSRWLDEGQPTPFEFGGHTYQIEYDNNKLPVFWEHHGWLWQPWQLELHHMPQPEGTVIGGFGTGKTAEIAMDLAVCAMTIPNFRGFAVAPQMIQAMEVYKYIMLFKETPFFQRFVWSHPQKPYPKIVVKNDYVGESTIEILSIEHDPEKVRTLEGDKVYLDQAEKIEELDDLVRDLGTRLRGQVHGRERLGQLILVANAGNNPALWVRYDMAQWHPDVYRSFSPRTDDNPYLSATDKANFRRRVGGSQQEIDQWLNAKRPMGTGKHFPPDMVMACCAPELDNTMAMMLEEKERQLQLGEADQWTLGFVKESTQKVGVYHWEMPPDHRSGRKYIVTCDPGQSNPPDRNSAVIMVWDVTDFPQKAAIMRAFHWVFSNGSYWPFLLEYERMVKLYKAQGRNGFDSTGVQKGFDELVFATMGLHAQGLNMAMNGKYLALNALKFYLGKQLMIFPYIERLMSQLTNYDLPDTKIAQDLVMGMAMSAEMLRQIYGLEITDEEEMEEIKTTIDRHDRPMIDRDARPVAVQRERKYPRL